MNKKWIKIIDFLNMIHSGEKPPEKIIISGHRYKYNEKSKDYDSDMGFDNEDLFLHIGILKELDTEIGILEDNTEEIEELTYYCIGNAKSTDQTKMIDKINELVKVVKEIRKDLNKEHCCCCGVEITDENRALHNMCKECKYGIDWEEKTK